MELGIKRIITFKGIVDTPNAMQVSHWSAERLVHPNAVFKPGTSISATWDTKKSLWIASRYANAYWLVILETDCIILLERSNNILSSVCSLLVRLDRSCAWQATVMRTSFWSLQCCYSGKQQSKKHDFEVFKAIIPASNNLACEDDSEDSKPLLQLWQKNLSDEHTNKNKVLFGASNIWARDIRKTYLWNPRFNNDETGNLVHLRIFFKNYLRKIFW